MKEEMQEKIASQTDKHQTDSVLDENDDSDYDMELHFQCDSDGSVIDDDEEIGSVKHPQKQLTPKEKMVLIKYGI